MARASLPASHVAMPNRATRALPGAPESCGPFRRQSVFLVLEIATAFFVKLTVDLRSFFLAHESRENHFAVLCFVSRIAHFLKFLSTGQSVEPNRGILLSLSGTRRGSTLPQHGPAV